MVAASPPVDDEARKIYRVSVIFSHGGVAERSKAPVLKTGRATALVGSNPTPSVDFTEQGSTSPAGPIDDPEDAPRGSARFLGHDLVDEERGDLSVMFVCRSCTDIYGPWKQGPEGRLQGCCRLHPGDSARWPRFDFNKVMELCRCCGRDIARSSGHRFSVWFCEPCRRRVVAFDQRCGRTIIPLGRHSIMAGVSISGREIADGSPVEPKIDNFSTSARGLFASMDHLEAWRRRTVAGHLKILGATGDVPVATYIRELSRLADTGVESLDKEKTFQGLREFFQEE
jgi:hypothetical protein